MDKNIYNCKLCGNYCTTNKYDWLKHVKTKKHLQNSTNKNYKAFVCDCGKSYKHLSGLSRHKNICVLSNNIIVKQQKQIDSLHMLLEKTIDSQKEMINKVGNTTNNMQINIFLNEECKNAMNLTEFVDSLNLSLEDLLYTSKNGHVKGITNILLKNLSELTPIERPIHCSNIQTLKFFVKEDNHWDENQMKVNQTIDTISQKQIKKISEWEDAHPNWKDTERGLEMYVEMVKEVMGEHIDKKYELIKQGVSNHININNVL